MPKYKSVLNGSAYITFLLTVPFFVLAQNNPNLIDTLPDSSEEVSLPSYPGTVECFDYYHFQSVQVNVAAEKARYSPGDEVPFRGEVTNNNSYPVVDGYIFVRVGLTNPEFRKQGHNVADEFFAMEHFSIDASTTMPIEFKWRVPKAAAAGEYIANYFFTVGKRFNLGGLPFSNEVVIGSTKFSVKSGGASGFLFDRGGATVNSGKYFQIGNWPQVNPDAPVVILQPLRNLDKFDKEVKVTYKLYYWDSLREEDKVAESSEVVQLKASDSKTLRYEIPKMNTSVYYLKILATTANDSAIVNIRVVSEQARPRINYPALTKFPILNGDLFSLFSCFHNTSGANAEGAVSVFLSDREGNKVGEASYIGIIPPKMLAITGEISAKKNYDYLKLHAEIKSNTGVTIDSYDTVYDCSEFKSSACDLLTKKSSARNIIIVIGLVIIAVLTFLGLHIIRNKKTNSLTTN